MRYLIVIFMLFATLTLLGGGCEKVKYRLVGPEMTITTTSLPNPRFGELYNAEVRVQGGIPSYTWSISQGNLPDGLTLNGDNGCITGRPHKAGEFTFTIQVTDDNRVSISNQFSLYTSAVHYNPEWMVGLDFDNTGNFKSSDSVAVDSSENSYLLDRENNKILKFDSNRNLLFEIKPTSGASFYGPDEIFTDSSDNLIIRDYKTIYLLSSNSAFITTWYASEVDYIRDSAIDSYDYLYFLDEGECTIYKYNLSGNLQFSFGNTSIFNYPREIAVDLENNIYVVDDGASGYRVQKFNAAGNLIFSWENTNYDYCRGIAVNSSGNCFILNSSTDEVEKFDNNGNLLLTWGGYGTDDGYFRSFNCIVVVNGSVYISDYSNLNMQKFDLEGIFVSKIHTDLSANESFNEPAFITKSPNSNLYVSDAGNHRIKILDNSGIFVSSFGSEGVADDQFRYPQGIVFSSNACFICDAGNNRIKKYDLNNNFIKSWGGYGAGNSQFNEPMGIAIGPNENLYVTDNYNDRVQIFDLNGDFISSFIIPNPRSIAVNNAGDIYVTTYYGAFKLDNQGTLLSILGSQDYQDEDFIDGPFDIAIEKYTGDILISDAYANRILKFDSQESFITTISSQGTDKGKVNYPRGITLDNGDLYVVDSGNYRIQKLSPNPERGNAPEIKISSWLQGGPYFISNSSTTTLLFFWSSSYRLSDSVDTLHQLSSDFGGNLNIIAIGTYNMEEDYANNMISSYSMLFPVALDDGNTTVDAYNCNTPKAVLIDKYGSIIWKSNINSYSYYLLIKQQIDNLLN